MQQDLHTSLPATVTAADHIFPGLPYEAGTDCLKSLKLEK